MATKASTNATTVRAATATAAEATGTVVTTDKITVETTAEVKVPETKETVVATATKVKTPTEVKTDVEVAQVEVIALSLTNAINAAGDNTTDKLHLNNIISNMNGLLEITTEELKAAQYDKAASHIIGIVNSLGRVSDKVFIPAFTSILDTVARAISSETSYLLTHPARVYRIFVSTATVRGLTEGHADFITALIALAPKATRKKVGQEADIQRMFAALPDAKRNRIKDMMR